MQIRIVEDHIKINSIAPHMTLQIVTKTSIPFFTLFCHILCGAPEKYYQDKLADKLDGRTEVTANDRTRCDILTDTHAIEVDFAHKWSEAIGQSLNYGIQFNRKAGIILILNKPADSRHLTRVRNIVKHYQLPIDVWEVKAVDFEK